MKLLEQTRSVFSGLMSTCCPGVDRRADPRFPASARMRITWTDRTGSHRISGLFVDISRGGAAIRAAGHLPGVSATVRVGQEGTRWAIDAEVRGVHPSSDGTTLIRLAFRERCPSSTVAAVAGVRIRRRSRQHNPIGPECLEGRQLLSTVVEFPQALVTAEVAPAVPSSDLLSMTLYDLADDAFLSDVLYSTPKRMASGIAESGAIGVNAAWEDGLSTTWFIEQQRYGADFVQAGLIRADDALVARGWQILDWGFARQAADGSFAGTGDAFHSTSMFIEAAARSLLLTAQSQSSDAPQILAKYLPKLEAAAQWLTIPSVMTKGNGYDAPYTHRRWLLAAALGETAAALRSQAGTALFGDLYQAEAETYDQLAASYASQGLALQDADGMNPEKGASDTSYQAYGILMAQRYLSTCPSADLRGEVKDMVVSGLNWLSARIDDQGQVITIDDTRTGIEPSRSGTTKSIDYKTMIQAFSCATTTTDDEAYREVARRLAVGRGWIQ